jgi:NUMOD3 motif/HNH endonuclease
MRGGKTRFKKGMTPHNKGKSTYPRVIGSCLFCKKDIIAKKIKDNYKGRKFCGLSCKSFFVAMDRKSNGLPIGIPLKKGNTLRKNKPNSLESILKAKESRKWYRPTIETRNKISESNKGKKMSEEAKRKISESHKGEKHFLFGKHHSIETRKKMSDVKKGSKSPLWKGGITSVNKAIRTSLEYRLWREAVFLRDNWTCQWCLVRGGKLNADHIKPFAYFPELRFAIDNGRTLCEKCHSKTDTYKYKAKKYEK